jgi:hypothetical protein
MAASSDYTKPTYVDMSDLCPLDVALTGGASMSAGNTTSQPLPANAGGAPGSRPVNGPPPGVTLDNSGLEIEPVHDYTQKAGK